jgi:hypothetical protein
MAAAVPIALCSAPSRTRTATALVAVGAIALIRLAGTANDAAPSQGLPPPLQLANMVLRQQPAVRVIAAAREGSGRGACVIVLAGTGKLSVGAEGSKRDVTISLPTCDLYNASRGANSTELADGAHLSARSIFLSSTYALGPGAIMSASKYLATHAWPADNPYARLTVPGYSGCTRNKYKLDKRQNETVSPGVYCGGIEVAGGATLDLEPGGYIIDQGNFAVGDSATVRGTGVTIILTSRNGSNYGTVDIRGGSTIAISAPVDSAAGGIPGIAMWIDERAPAADAILDGGDTQNVNGVLYLPSRRVRYSGGSPAGTLCSQLVALTVAFTGNSYFRHDCAGAGVSDPAPPPLLPD